MRPLFKELALPLLLALIHGTIYLLLIPPWQHYDEPGHMEYVWHIAHKQQLPLPTDVDRDMRFDFVESMSRNGFFGSQTSADSLDRVNGPTPGIGFVQLEDPPVYYLAPAIAVWMVRDQPIEMQLYAARSVSLAMLLFCVICAWGVARELAPSRHALRWMLPFSIAALPPFVDLMTAVNSDVGAISAYSFFLWGSVRLIARNKPARDGVETAITVLWILASVTLCLAVKASAASAALLMVPVLFFGLMPAHRQWMIWSVLVVTTVVTLLTTFRYGDALGWYRNASIAREPLTRCDKQECGALVHGEHAIRLVPTGGLTSRLLQSLPPAYTREAKSRVVTIAGWMWTSGNSTEVPLPALSANYLELPAPMATLAQTPTFFAYTQTIPNDTHYLKLQLSGPATGDAIYDGLIMIVSDRPQSMPSEISATHVTWAGNTYANLIRNGSGETASIGLRPTALTILDEVTPRWLDWTFGVATIADLHGTGWYYLLVARRMFETYWGSFAWGQVTAPAPLFWLIGACLLLLAPGAVKAALERARAGQSGLIAIGIAALIITILPAVLRGSAFGIDGSIWLPGARYVFPAIILFMLPLLAGLLRTTAYLNRSHLAPALLQAFCGLLCAVGLVTNALYFGAAR